MENEISPSYLKQIQKYPLLNQQEERELATKISQGDKNSLTKLINSNLRLVVSIASKFIGKKMPVMDLVQEGNIGLMIAAQKFRKSFNTKFSTYAYPWILQYILRYINSHSQMISLPIRREELKKSVKSAQNILFQKNGRVPQSEEIALFMGIEKSKVDDILLNSYTVSSFDSCESENGENLSLADFIADSAMTPEEKIIFDDERNEILKKMNCLKENEKKVLWYRFNFDGDIKIPTLREVSGLIGVSPEAIRQTEIRALKHLKFAVSQ